MRGQNSNYGFCVRNTHNAHLEWDLHLLGHFVFQRLVIGSQANISAFSPSVIYFLIRAHTDTET
ncbi:MAG: hypothetical protein ACP5HZ_12760, partial [Ferrimicrobium sp.]